MRPFPAELLTLNDAAEVRPLPDAAIARVDLVLF